MSNEAVKNVSVYGSGDFADMVMETGTRGEIYNYLKGHIRRHNLMVVDGTAKPVSGEEWFEGARHHITAKIIHAAMNELNPNKESAEEARYIARKWAEELLKVL